MLCISIALVSGAQSNDITYEQEALFPGFVDDYRGKSAIRIMFYNLENLFDTVDDTLKNDEAFLPQGDHHWNSYKYNDKLNDLSKVIRCVGGWEYAELIGVCEVENKSVLTDLTQQMALENAGYHIIHQESPDNRGIDVAMLYRPDKIKIDSFAYIYVDLGPGQRPTRDILYAKVRTLNDAQIHVFINHWPSRYGGEYYSAPKRKIAAQVLRTHIDSIMRKIPQANIIVMGDFNDDPKNQSIKEVLRAKTNRDQVKATDLYNAINSVDLTQGTSKYKGDWNTFDQIMVSQALLTGETQLHIDTDAHIFEAPFLFTKETKYPGVKPYRTYNGFKYVGGYSDHLPVYIDLQLQKR